MDQPPTTVAAARLAEDAHGDLRASLVDVARFVYRADRLALEQMSYVTWSEQPPFWRSGRTAWTRLHSSVPADLPAVHHVSALKLKGVGLSGGEGSCEPPPLRRFSHKRPHIGITEDGDLQMIWPERTPEGGIFLDRAEQEFENARYLSRFGCPSVVPVALYRYEDLQCDWQPDRPLGAVLTASPDREPYRANSLFDVDPVDRSAEAAACREMIRDLGGTRLAAIEAIAFEYGRTLRQFHECGLYRHNANPDNLAFSAALRRVYLTDLDSSRRLSECSDRRRPLEVLRDIAGGVFNLAAAFMRPHSVHRFPPDEVRRSRVFPQFLSGYFRRDSIPIDGRATNVLLRHFLPRQAAFFDACADQGSDPYAAAELQLDQALIFSSVMSGLVPVFVRSRLMTSHPITSDPRKVSDDLASSAEALTARSET